MAKLKKKRRVVAEVEIDESTRDTVMARLAAARSCAAAVVDAIDEAIALFVEPEEDDDASERLELIETALETAGMASRALEAAKEAMPGVDPEECEPWDEDADDDDDDDDKDIE